MNDESGRERVTANWFNRNPGGDALGSDPAKDGLLETLPVVPARPDHRRYANEERPNSIPNGRSGRFAVILRLVHHNGDEEWWPARAVRWTDDHVLVQWEETPGDSSSGSYIWVRSTDVRRLIKISAEEKMADKDTAEGA